MAVSGAREHLAGQWKAELLQAGCLMKAECGADEKSVQHSLLFFTGQCIYL